MAVPANGLRVESHPTEGRDNGSVDSGRTLDSGMDLAESELHVDAALQDRREQVWPRIRPVSRVESVVPGTCGGRVNNKEVTHNSVVHPSPALAVPEAGIEVLDIRPYLTQKGFVPERGLQEDVPHEVRIGAADWEVNSAELHAVPDIPDSSVLI